MSISCLLLLLILLGVSHCQAYVIISKYEYQYYNKTIECIEGENCEIRCLHGSSCMYSQMNCPYNFNCSVYFDSMMPGVYSTINAKTSQNLAVYVSSTADDGVAYADIFGPKETLNIQCGSSYGCDHTTIDSPNSTEINIECLEWNSCQYMKLFADQSTSISISCLSDYSCQQFQIYHQSTISPSSLFLQCQSDQSCHSSLIKSNSDNMHVVCAAKDACKYSDVYCLSNNSNCTMECGTNACTDADIYAVQGIFDVSVLGQSSQTNLNLHCTVNYYKSCALKPGVANDNHMLCDDDEVCMNYQLNDYNIIILHDYAKYNQTIECNEDTDCNVYCLGEYSCAYSTIICPENNKSITCTIYCEWFSCSHSIIVAINISSLIINVSEKGLQYASIEASYLDLVTMICDAFGSCSHTTMSAMNTMQINIDCLDSTSCDESKFNHISTGDYHNGYDVACNFTVHCFGSNSCRSVIGSNSGYLNIDCNEGCNNLALYCPESSVLLDVTDDSVSCDVLCEATDSCNGLDIYSINGWNNLRIWTIDNQYPPAATIYCNPTFTESCDIDGDIDNNNTGICCNYRLDVNATHIITKYSYEYYNRTIECPLDEDCYIYCITEGGCQYSTITCSNANCSIYCTTDDCQYYTIFSSNSTSVSVTELGSRLGLPRSTVYSLREYQLHDNQIMTQYNYQYSYIVMICNDTGECNIHCIHDSGCKYSLVQCPMNYKCNVFCEYRSSCRYLTIHAAHNGELNLVCSDFYSCREIIIKSMQTSKKVSIICSASYSCELMQIFVEYVAQVQIDCLSTQSCGYSTIYQHSTSSSNSTADIGCIGRHSCSSMTVYTNVEQAKITCNEDQSDDYGCNSMDIHYDNENIEDGLVILCSNINSCKNMNYYVLTGEFGVNITAFSTTDVVTNILYCCHTNIYSCELKAQSLDDQWIWLCEDENSICANNSNSCPTTRIAHIITIYKQYEYYNGSIECTNNADCSVICDASYSCAYAHIRCPNGYNCNIFCNDEYSCSHATITATDSNSLKIFSTKSYALHYGTITAPMNQNQLEMFCKASSSCHSIEINAMYSYIKTIQCAEPFSCSNIKLSAEYASFIEWNCIANYACKYGMAFHHNTTSSYFGLSCAGDSACDYMYVIASAAYVNINCNDTCQSLQIYCNTDVLCNITCLSPNGCNEMDIFAKNGPDTVNIISAKQLLLPNIAFHCGLIYEYSCNLRSSNATNRLQCDEKEECFDYSVDYQTTHHILIEWDYYSYMQNISCNSSMQNCHIYCVGENACAYSKIHCSDSHSVCTLYGGQLSVSNAEIYAISNSFVVNAQNVNALSYASIYLRSETAVLNCDDSSSCESLSLLTETEVVENIILNCGSVYSCRDLTLSVHDFDANMLANCIGYQSCYNLDIYMDNTDGLHVNCTNGYSCQQLQIYSAIPMLYDSLTCVTSTACNSLSVYCSYPLLDYICSMEYESSIDLWSCVGDRCFHDGCDAYTGLQLQPNASSILGGSTIIINGLCFDGNVNYTCKFGIEETELVVINKTYGYCVSPPVLESEYVLFAIHEDNEWYGIVSTFYYYDLYLNYEVEVDLDLLFNDTDVNVTWSLNPHSTFVPEYININLYQVIPYLADNNALYLGSRYLLTLAENTLRDGAHNVHFDFHNISSSNINTEWNIFDSSNTSQIFNVFVVIIEATGTTDQIPVAYRYVSNYFDHISYPALVPGRRRILQSEHDVYGGPDYSKAYYVELCKQWLQEDEAKHGAWWKDRNLPDCPDTDPSDNIKADLCTGEWEIDKGCNKFSEKGEKGCDKWHTGANGCIRSPEGQQCCYDKYGVLCRYPPCAGTADLSPAVGIWGIVKHYFVDVMPFIHCTEAGMVEEYYKRRPANMGGGGTAEQACAPVGGDPHFVTFDLFNYTFNGIGDYYYLYHEHFKILIRMEKFNRGSIITTFGLNIETNSTSFNRSANAIINTLEIAIDKTNKIFNIYINGEMMLFSENMYGLSIAIDDIVIIYNELNVIIRCAFNVFVELWLRNIDETLSYIEYNLDLGAIYQEQISGLVGNYDSISSNDLQSRNSTILSDDSTMEQIHYDFGLSWLLTNNDVNIFHTEFVADIDPFHHQPLFNFENIDAELYEIAVQQCGEQFSCIFDVMATEVIDIANQTLEFVQFVKVILHTEIFHTSPTTLPTSFDTETKPTAVGISTDSTLSKTSHVIRRQNEEKGSGIGITSIVIIIICIIAAFVSLLLILFVVKKRTNKARKPKITWKPVNTSEAASMGSKTTELC